MALTKGLPVQFPVREHAWVVGQVPSRGCARDNYTQIFPSLSFSLPFPPPKNTILKKKKNKSPKSYLNTQRMEHCKCPLAFAVAAEGTDRGWRGQRETISRPPGQVLRVPGRGLGGGAVNPPAKVQCLGATADRLTGREKAPTRSTGFPGNKAGEKVCHGV